MSANYDYDWKMDLNRVEKPVHKIQMNKIKKTPQRLRPIPRSQQTKHTTRESMDIRRKTNTHGKPPRMIGCLPDHRML